MAYTEEQKEKKREYYRKNRDRLLEKQRNSEILKRLDPEYCKKSNESWRLYTRNNYEARTLASIKSKCKKYNLPFNLDITDIVIPEVCPKTGIKLRVHTERGKYIDTPSIDRIIPKLGYIKGNIQIVCYWYNIAKFTWEEETFIEMCKQIIKLNETK